MTHPETTTHCGGCSVSSATSFLQPFSPSSLEGDTRGTEQEVDCIEGRRKEGAELLGGLKTNLKRNHKIRDVCLWRLMRPERKLCLHGSVSILSPFPMHPGRDGEGGHGGGGVGADPAVITGRLQEGARVSRGRSLCRSVFQGCSVLLPCNGSPKLMSTVAPTGGGFISTVALPGSEISKRG